MTPHPDIDAICLLNNFPRKYQLYRNADGTFTLRHAITHTRTLYRCDAATLLRWIDNHAHAQETQTKTPPEEEESRTPTG